MSRTKARNFNQRPLRKLAFDMIDMIKRASDRITVLSRNLHPVNGYTLAIEYWSAWVGDGSLFFESRHLLWYLIRVI